jgi:septal ring factor EnvC (AmiA/AmiB activator)
MYSTPYKKVLICVISFLPDIDSGSLLKIQDTVHSYKKLIHLKSSHCEVLNRKIKKMEKMISALQKELSETEQEKLEQEKEVCNLRYDILVLNKCVRAGV